MKSKTAFEKNVAGSTENVKTSISQVMTKVNQNTSNQINSR